MSGVSRDGRDDHDPRDARDGRGSRDLSRRDALKRMGGGVLGLGAGYSLPSPVLESFLRLSRQGPWEWAFFTPAELPAMNVLADMIIPADERSGSATDAGTVEYVDFVLSISNEGTQARWREGLAWLDGETARRHGALVAELGAESAGDPVAGFADAPAGLRAQVLNLVAWPDGAPPGLEERAAWFTHVRDLVGSGFFSSRMGVEDIGYQGAYMRPTWEGAPLEALDELGLSYEKWDARYGDAT